MTYIGAGWSSLPVEELRVLAATPTTRSSGAGSALRWSRTAQTATLGGVLPIDRRLALWWVPKALITNRPDGLVSLGGGASNSWSIGANCPLLQVASRPSLTPTALCLLPVIGPYSASLVGGYVTTEGSSAATAAALTERAEHGAAPGSPPQPCRPAAEAPSATAVSLARFFCLAITRDSRFSTGCSTGPDGAPLIGLPAP